MCVLWWNIKWFDHKETVVCYFDLTYLPCYPSALRYSMWRRRITRRPDTLLCVHSWRSLRVAIWFCHSSWRTSNSKVLYGFTLSSRSELACGQARTALRLFQWTSDIALETMLYNLVYFLYFQLDTLFSSVYIQYLLSSFLYMFQASQVHHQEV